MFRTNSFRLYGQQLERVAVTDRDTNTARDTDTYVARRYARMCLQMKCNWWPFQLPVACIIHATNSIGMTINSYSVIGAAPSPTCPSSGVPECFDKDVNLQIERSIIEDRLVQKI